MKSYLIIHFYKPNQSRGDVQNELGEVKENEIRKTNIKKMFLLI